MWPSQDFFKINSIIIVVDETKLTEEIKKISGEVISTLFEQRKVDDLVKHYTEDCKFIFLPENQTMSGR